MLPERDKFPLDRFPGKPKSLKQGKTYKVSTIDSDTEEEVKVNAKVTSITHYPDGHTVTVIQYKMP